MNQMSGHEHGGGEGSIADTGRITKETLVEYFMYFVGLGDKTD